MVNVETAWGYEVGDTGIYVAHYDLGVDYRHPDLGVEVGPDMHVRYAAQYYPPAAGQPFEPVWKNSQHGIRCMGIIGALINRTAHSVAGMAGGWGTLAAPGCDNTERGNGASLIILGDWKEIRPLGITAAIFEASAKSPVTGYGFGTNIINVSAKMTDYAD